MSRPSSSKIFVKNKDEIKALMWASVANDESVMMGFPWSYTESIEMVMDKELGNLKKEEIFTTTHAGSAKITFHRSGNYKLSSEMGINESTRDRVTVVGLPLTEITAPQRMAEILIPSVIPGSKYTPTNNDIVIDISGADSKLTRCTIGCMSNAEFDVLRSKDVPMVDTSEWEVWDILATDSHTWIWVLRRSRYDLYNPNKFYVTLLGNPKWGSTKELC